MACNNAKLDDSSYKCWAVRTQPPKQTDLIKVGISRVGAQLKLGGSTANCAPAGGLWVKRRSLRWLVVEAWHGWYLASPISRWQPMANTEYNAIRIRSERDEGSNPGEGV